MKCVIKIVVFLAVFFIIFSFTENIFKKYHPLEHTLSQVKKNKSKPQILFVGSSHSGCSYDPRIFETDLNVTSYNLNSDSQRLPATQELLKYIIPNVKPKLLIVDIFNNSIILDDYTEKQKYFQNFVFDNISSAGKINTMNNIYGLENIFSSFSTTVRNHSEWNKLNRDNFKRDLFVGGDYEYYNGFKTKRDFIKDNITIINKVNFKDTLSEKQIKLLDDFLLNLKRLNTEFLIISSPSLEYQTNYKYKKKQQILKNYFKNRNTTFLDINDYFEDLKLDKSHFRDMTHLNVSGALIVSQFLVSYLKENYTFNKENIISNTNRYLHIEQNFKNALFNNKDTIDIGGDKITELAVYKTQGGNLELLFNLEKYTAPINVNFYFDLNKQEYFEFPKENFVKIGNNQKIVEVNEKDLITYNGKLYAVCALFLPVEKIRSLDFFIGNNQDIAYSIKDEQLVINSKSLLFEKEFNSILIDTLSLKKILINKNVNHEITLNFNSDFDTLKYNIGAHIFYDNNETQIVDTPFIIKNGILKLYFKAKENNIIKLKFFLYDRKGYSGALSNILWVNTDE